MVVFIFPYATLLVQHIFFEISTAEVVIEVFSVILFQTRSTVASQIFCAAIFERVLSALVAEFSVISKTFCSYLIPNQ